MTKNDRQKKNSHWDYALLYLALLKRGELIPVYEEARRRAWRSAKAVSRRKAA